MLGVERVVVQRRRRQRAELVQLEAAGLAHEPLPGAVLLATHAHEQVGEVEPGQPVLRVAEMEDLPIIFFGLVMLIRFWMIAGRQPSIELSRAHGHAPAAHVA